MKRQRMRMPMRFQGEAGGGAAGGGSAAGDGGGDSGGAGGTSGDGDPGGAGGKSDNELQVLKRKLEKAERDKAKALEDLETQRKAALSEDERKQQEAVDAAYKRGIDESNAKVREAEMRGEIRAAMSTHGIPSELYDSFRAALGGDVEVADVEAAAKALVEKGGVWGQFGAADASGNGNGTQKGKAGPSHKPAPKGFTGVDPWAAETWSLTEQAKLYRSDPELAKQLMERNGAKLGQPRPTKSPV